MLPNGYYLGKHEVFVPWGKLYFSRANMARRKFPHQNANASKSSGPTIYGAKGNYWQGGD